MSEPIATVGDLAGICGSEDGTDWEKILIDASRRLVVAVASVVAQDAQMHGHYDGAWQKQPLIFGYGGVIAERESDASAPAGLNTFTTTPVPAGEIHIINTLSAINYNSITTNLHIDMNHDGAFYGFYREPDVAAATMALVNGPIVLDAGDYIRCRFYGVTLNDSLAFDITGYKMDLDL